MRLKFVVNIVRLKVYNYDQCQSDGLDLHLRLHVRPKRDYFLTCNISDNTQAITIKLGKTVELWMPDNYAHARFDDLNLDARSQLVGKGKTSALHALGKSKAKHQRCMVSASKQSISI